MKPKRMQRTFLFFLKNGKERKEGGRKEGNQLVGMGRRAAEIRVVLIGEKHPDVSWKPLQEEGG